MVMIAMSNFLFALVIFGHCLTFSLNIKIERLDIGFDALYHVV